MIATRATCGFASQPKPVTTPAISSEGGCDVGTARITSQQTTLVLSRSSVVVVTKCPVANATPDEAAHDAAISWARPAPPTSRATSAAITVVATAAKAEGSRNTSSDPGARWSIAQQIN